MVSPSNPRTLRTESLVKSFKGRQVVAGVSINLEAGEVVGLLGPNGAGKTTTFYMVLGLLKPDQGQVILNGEVVTDLPVYKRARKGLGFLPQEPSIFRKLTVEQNIMAILEILDLSEQERRQRLESLLQELDLTHLAKSKAYTLSGGERRRAEITRALVTSPDFMLLDEPFAGIDPIAIADIQTIIARLKAKGVGVLITDHNVRETLQIVDRAYLIYEGRVLVSGTAQELASDERAREIYLGERFSL
ncbi:MAG: LPS export ABC transporter ATP-binding protein [Candidatus Methylomirabilota bacterium]|nr:LPS export ABC transporter ATP-binding protein [Candidatus Methylomirabilis sp.]NJD69377.1 LPS export ABC transporter ATP-binding protein [candidate division NC10 bacterium]PWB47938.1 MAG: LPS export ABC transporter ATP-binding protein [candidate division NC10 bacterium]